MTVGSWCGHTMSSSPISILSFIHTPPVTKAEHAERDMEEKHWTHRLSSFGEDVKIPTYKRHTNPEGPL